MKISQAIVRPPSRNFANGLSSASLGKPDFDLALTQHAAYCEALQYCGVEVIKLPVDSRYPDATFVEDTAVVTPRGAVITRPAAPSRRGEVDSIRIALLPVFPGLTAIEQPGTVDGGDVCQVEGLFLIGLSQRTNEEGAKQLASWLAAQDYSSCVIDLRGREDLLHLKTGLSYLGDNYMAVINSLADESCLRHFSQVKVGEGESYAANCVRVNDWLLIAQGYPCFERKLHELGYKTIPVDVSEFRKMDGGLSCLSLRF